MSVPILTSTTSEDVTIASADFGRRIAVAEARASRTIGEERTVQKTSFAARRLDYDKSNISYRLYGLLLFVYPEDFRREFGVQMLQVFRDSYRDEARDGSLPSFWLRTLLDLVSTAVKERADSSQRGGVL